MSTDAKQFIVDLLEVVPTVRPTAEQALHSPWLDTLVRRRSLSIDHSKQRDQVQASLENFAGYTILKKLALMVVAHKSTSEEIGFLRRMFHRFDRSNVADITFDEFKIALQDYDYTEAECQRLFHGMDLDNSGVVHYSEFLAATIEAHGDISEERLAEAFDRIDADDSGYITVGDLRELLGDSVPSSYLNRIIDEADGADHDHKINYTEFLALWGAENDAARAKIMEQVVKRREAASLNSKCSADEPLLSPVSLECDDMVSDMSMDTSEEGSTEHNLFRNNKELSIRGHAELHGNRTHRKANTPIETGTSRVRVIGTPFMSVNEAQYADI